MRVIALMNQKGGVGKTTTTVNLGAALAELGQRVLLIDLDPQAHLTINYGVEPTADIINLYDVLIDERPLADAIRPAGERIHLVPSSIDLAAAEIELVTVLGREVLLKKRAEAANLDRNYDFVLLDCPPSLGLLTLNALSIAGEVIIPMQPHFLALQGVAKLLETIQLVNKRMNPRLKVSGIVLTMFDSQTKLSIEVVAELNGFIEAAKGKPLPWAEARVFQTKIRRNIKLAESPSFGQTVLAYETTSNGATDYRALAREVATMYGQTLPAPVIARPVRPISAGPPAAVAIPPAVRPPAPRPAAAVPPRAAAVARPAAAIIPPRPAIPKPVAPRPPVTAIPKPPIAAKPIAPKPRPVAPVAVAIPKPVPPAPKPASPISVTVPAVDPATLRAAQVTKPSQAAGTKGAPAADTQGKQGDASSDSPHDEVAA